MIRHPLTVAACTCAPGHLCDHCRHVRHAIARMMRLVRIEGPERNRQPVAYADQVTSLNDARTALCLALGLAVDDIHPSSGHDMSRGVR